MATAFGTCAISAGACSCSVVAFPRCSSSSGTGSDASASTSAAPGFPCFGSFSASSGAALSCVSAPPAPAPKSGLCALMKFNRRVSLCCQASSESAPATPQRRSILCQDCDGNGAVVCSQCNGGGMNTEDHFGGRFKAGTICWLCRGKKQMLCGNCNGAGFLGGFLTTQDD